MPLNGGILAIAIGKYDSIIVSFASMATMSLIHGGLALQLRLSQVA
jgi:hypothetical protein